MDAMNTGMWRNLRFFEAAFKGTLAAVDQRHDRIIYPAGSKVFACDPMLFAIHRHWSATHRFYEAVN